MRVAVFISVLHGALFLSSDGAGQVGDLDGVIARAQPCASLPDIVSWWPIEDSPTGSTMDVSDGNDGMQIGNVQREPGMVGQALKLDGIDAFVAVPDSPNPTLQRLTIEAWILVRGSNLQTVLTKTEAVNSLCRLAPWMKPPWTSPSGSMSGRILIALKEQ